MDQQHADDLVEVHWYLQQLEFVQAHKRPEARQQPQAEALPLIGGSAGRTSKGNTTGGSVETRSGGAAIGGSIGRTSACDAQ